MHLVIRPALITDLLLDANNHRFHDLDGWRRVADNRFHEPRIQANTENLLRDNRSFDLAQLKDSINTNGFVPLEQIVIRAYPTDNTKYIVVEGNRRVAAIKWLLEDSEAGVLNLSEDQLNNLQNLQVLYLDTGAAENLNAIEILMAIRHVTGIKEWGAYQQARLVADLMGHEGASFATVSAKLGMSSREVARRYRASRALEQMENDEEHREFAEPRMYAIFHEAVAQPTVRDWLGWDDNLTQFTNRENLHNFYSLISAEDDAQPKIRGYEDVRAKLKTILPHPRAVQVLLDPNRTLDDALQTAQEEAGGNNHALPLETVVQNTINFLEELPAARIRTLTEEQIAILNQLITRITTTLEDQRRLVAPVNG
jgi:ParB-like nuclease domain